MNSEAGAPRGRITMEALMAEADEAERMLAAKRAARAQARRLRTEGTAGARLQNRAISAPSQPMSPSLSSKTQRRLSSTRKSSSQADASISEAGSAELKEVSSKYEAALKTIASLEATKTTMAYELNKEKDKSEDLAEDLAEARTTVTRLKDQAVANACQIAELTESNAALVEAAQAANDAEPVEDPRIGQLQAQLERLTADLKDALATPDIDPEHDPEIKIERLNAQVRRLTEAKQQAEDAEDDAKREVRAVARNVRRLQNKIEEQEDELETLRDAYERLRSKLKSAQENKRNAWKPP